MATGVGGQKRSKIQLVVQVARSGSRLAISKEDWTSKSTTLLSIVTELKQEHSGVQWPIEFDDSFSLRYVQRTVPFSEWNRTTLGSIGIASGRVLLTLEQRAKAVEEPKTSETNNSSIHDTMEVDDGKDNSGSLEVALDLLLRSNFDADTKPCLITMCKVIDNVLQKPGNPKVRTIRLANPAFSHKVTRCKGGVEFLLACGFVQKQSTPSILSQEPSEALLVLDGQNEDVSHLVKARRLLTTRAITVLGMKSHELPKYKPPVPRNTAVSTTVATNSGSVSNRFDIYRGQRFDAKSAAVGEHLSPDQNYVSTTEKQLQMLQSKQAKMERTLHKELKDREMKARLPSPTHISLTTNQLSDNSAQRGGDGSLLVGQMKRMEAERKQREEGGFTTKAMRDLQAMKKQKVYSHVTLMIKFADGSSLSCKFLPKELVADVITVIRTQAFKSGYEALDFDLYVSPPRRKLDRQRTLQDEGLVPAAKVFVAWIGPGPQTPEVGQFLHSSLFGVKEVTAVIPSGKRVTGQDDDRKLAPDSKTGGDQAKQGSDRESELLKRMMGGGKSLGIGGKKSSRGNSGGKPKSFKG